MHAGIILFRQPDLAPVDDQHVSAILDLPEAARQELLKFEPAEPPTHDIFDPPTDRRIQRAKAQFLLDAPRLAGGRQLLLDPLALQPYPHQHNVARRASGTYPHPYLFCDEVGLGKTIEAGLALRALLLSGAVRRVLLLTPKALVRQWQEELREKFALTAWFCDGKTLVDVGGRVREVGAPWDESGIIAASHQLVARRARHDEILGTSPWDLVIVDEGHRARRRAMDDPSPNLLLSLLRRMQAQGKITCLWLLTATPMQLDPCEVHDLLRLCGVDHRWADWAGEDGFRGYFDDLQRFAVKADVRRHVLQMADVARAHGAEALRPDAPPEDWDGARWRHLVQLIQRRADALALAMTRLTPAEASSLARRLVRQTPLGVFMFRHTRATLRRYVAEGLLQAPVPTRDPEDRVVAFSNPAEEELYRRIDRYCEEFYRALDPDSRGGMGFLVAVYRKRLTSSFTALIKSLERRIALLDIARETMLPTEEVQVLAETGAEVDEDESAEDPDREEPPDRPEPRSWVARAELDRLRGLPPGAIEKERAFLVEYVRDLHRVVSSGEESKLQVFREELARLVDQGHRILVFTMYRDTMDFLRDRLVSRFSGRMACYSGRGGEVYDVSRGWIEVEKAEIKRRADSNHPRSLEILLCTDAASEGVNLQHFSAIINYDLPWNPMRVEQRIGRIDRIGQQAPKVRIVNLYIQDTIENDAYHVLIRRIGFFRQVVGPLQPILAAIPRLIRAVSIEGEDRAAALRRLEAAAAEEVGSSIPELDECALGDGGPGREEAATAPLTQRELADWLPHRRPSGLRLIPFTPDTSVRTPSFPDCTFILTWAGAPASLGIRDGDEVRVTLDPAIADAFPPTAPSADEGVERGHREGIRLLTWGDPLLEAWLEALRGATLTNEDWAPLGVHRRKTGSSVEYTPSGPDPRTPIKDWCQFCNLVNGSAVRVWDVASCHT